MRSLIHRLLRHEWGGTSEVSRRLQRPIRRLRRKPSEVFRSLAGARMAGDASDPSAILYRRPIARFITTLADYHACLTLHLAGRAVGAARSERAIRDGDFAPPRP